MSFNEIKQHGTLYFPFELYKVDENHPRYDMALHWHTSIELIRVISGELTVTLDNKRYIASPGDIYISNSETVHGASPKHCTYECIVFNLAFLHTGNPQCDAIIDDYIHRNRLFCDKVEDGQAKAILTGMFTALDSKESGYMFSVLSSLTAFMGRCEQAGLYVNVGSESSDHNEKNVHKLKKAIKFIRDNYDKPITLDDVAMITGLSTKYFCAFFKRMTEKTPVEYLNMYRIEKAAQKLISSDMSVTDVAYSSGFNDLSYFIKLFKTLKGCTPKSYRDR